MTELQVNVLGNKQPEVETRAANDVYEFVYWLETGHGYQQGEI